MQLAKLDPQPEVTPFFLPAHGVYVTVMDGVLWTYPMTGPCSADVEWSNGGPAEDTADGAADLLADATRALRATGYLGPVELGNGL